MLPAGNEVAFGPEAVAVAVLRRRAGELPAVAGYAGLWKGGLPIPADWLAACVGLVKQHDQAAFLTRYGCSVTQPSASTCATAKGR